MDFGAFVELEPGIEGLIHVSEMSWVKKVQRPSDILKPGDTVEAVILSVSGADKTDGAGVEAGAGRSVGGCGEEVSGGVGGRGHGNADG